MELLSTMQQKLTKYVRCSGGHSGL